MWGMVFPRVKPKPSRVPFVCKGREWKVEVAVTVAEAETVAVTVPIEEPSCCEVLETETEQED
jgi:hypothetical protein